MTVQFNAALAAGVGAPTDKPAWGVAAVAAFGATVRARILRNGVAIRTLPLGAMTSDATGLMVSTVPTGVATSGAAVAPGDGATWTLTLEGGTSYGSIATLTHPADCTIPAMGATDLGIGFLSSFKMLAPASLPAFTPPVAGEPYRQIIENWASGSAVDLTPITMAYPTSSGSFVDAAFSSQCSTWQEFGPTEAESALPVLNEIRFTAIKFKIPAGGIYTSVAYRVVTMMHSVSAGVRAGIFGNFGNPANKTKPTAFKIRTEDYFGTVLGREEMRDGLPINSSSFVQDFRSSNNANLTVAARPFVTCASSFRQSFGPTPISPTINLLPRGDSRASVLTATTLRSTAYNGGQTEFFMRDPSRDSGYTHPRITPQWAMSPLAASTLALTGLDSEMNYESPGKYAASLQIGWGKEPGAPGLINYRGGPGGGRQDRAIFPCEILQMFIRDQNGARAHDGALHYDMAMAFIGNSANYPAFRHVNYRTLRPINVFANDAPVAVGEVAKFYHTYYDALTPYTGTSGIRLIDAYGTPAPWGELDALGLLAHPFNGALPDPEHSNHVGMAHATFILADPSLQRMNEHMVTEALMAGGGWVNNYIFDSSAISTPAVVFESRPFLLPFAHLAYAWKIATTNSTYTRAAIELRMRQYLVDFKAQIWDQVPGSGGSIQQVAWQKGYRSSVHFRLPGVSDPEQFTGWCTRFNLGSVYLGQVMTLLKTYGLEDVLRTGGTGPQNAACSYFFDQCYINLKHVADVFVAAPWCWAQDGSLFGDAIGSAHIPVRSVSQGAVNDSGATLPAFSSTTVITNAGTNPRGDNKWWLNVAGGSRANGQLTDFWRIGTAQLYAQFCMPVGAARTTMLSQFDAWCAALTTQITATAPANRAADAAPGCTLQMFACPQTIPAVA